MRLLLVQIKAGLRIWHLCGDPHTGRSRSRCWPGSVSTFLFSSSDTIISGSFIAYVGSGEPTHCQDLLPQGFLLDPHDVHYTGDEDFHSLHLALALSNAMIRHVHIGGIPKHGVLIQNACFRHIVLPSL